MPISGYIMAALVIIAFFAIWYYTSPRKLYALDVSGSFAESGQFQRTVEYIRRRARRRDLIALHNHKLVGVYAPIEFKEMDLTKQVGGGSDPTDVVTLAAEMERQLFLCGDGMLFSDLPEGVDAVLVVPKELTYTENRHRGVPVVRF